MATASDILKKIEEEEARQATRIREVEQESERATDKNFILETISNVPGSAAQFAKDMITPILSPIETATNLKELVSSTINLIKPGEQGNEELARQVGQYYKDRYGGFENIKNTISQDPVGFVGDLALGLTTGGAGLRATGQAGKISQFASEAGRLVDPAAATARGVGTGLNLAGRGARKVVGTATGLGEQPFKQALLGGEEFTSAMRGKVDETEIVAEAKRGLDDLKEVRRKEFAKEQKELFPKLEEKKIASETRDRILNIVNDIRDEATRTSGVSRIRQGGDVQDVLKEVESVLKNAEKAVDGADLAFIFEQLNDIGKGLDFTKQSGQVFADAKSRFKTELDQFTPDGYTEFLETYAQQSSDIDLLRREIGLGEKKSTSAAFTKLSRALRNPKSALAKAFEKLPENRKQKISESISGYLLSEALPAGLSRSLTASLVTPTAIGGGMVAGLSGALAPLAGLGLVSPRLTGEITRGIGVGRRGVQAVAPYARVGTGLLRQVGATQEEMERQGLL